MYLARFHSYGDESWQAFVSRKELETAVRQRIVATLLLPQDCHLADVLRQLVASGFDFDTSLQLYNEWFGSLYGHVLVESV